MSFFPQTNIKSNGANFAEQNRKCGTFTGKIARIRQITSKNNPTVFAVIELEAPNEPGVFQDYLNFNPQKAEKSMGFLVAHAKSAVLSTGNTVDETEKDMNWVESAYAKIGNEQLDVCFTQSMNANGQLNINYIPKNSQMVQQAIATPEIGVPPMKPAF